MNKPHFCWNFFLIDWRHKSVKNTVDLLLFYGEHSYEFSENEIGNVVLKLMNHDIRKNKWLNINPINLNIEAISSEKLFDRSSDHK